ncbi:hypothetical protein CLOSTMETH_02704 [[Clostridium] methylpentosum DSM 5476]|uniref:Uncharacterized protein n=1 Tax=[Clostridium] methylpentosum DSM 5476 TaxID=537013 RepID=C0EFR2_9FIRM|nr:hypothetical protein CLOSTMETH_02704 [[Clostridium] methylpentosum DSM 5476]
MRKNQIHNFAERKKYHITKAAVLSLHRWRRKLGVFVRKYASFYAAGLSSG